MTGKLKIEIVESVETLSNLLKQEKNPQKKERIQALYWIKTNLAESIGHLSSLSGKHRTTVSRWLSSYRKGGMSKMLDIYTTSGRPPAIPLYIQQALINELNEKEGFNSYKEIKTWLYTVHDLDVAYKVVHDTVRYRLKAKLKVPRRSNVKKDAEAEAEFKKKIPEIIEKELLFYQDKRDKYQEIRYWVQDESRFGLHTIERKIRTMMGVQPLGFHQYKYDYLWLYGLVEPIRRENFFEEWSHLNSDCFQSYLDSFSKKYSKDLHFIQLDNGRFHYKEDLEIPDNIIFIFQPPYTPEVNPIERLWRYLKDQLQWYVFENLDPLRITLSKTLNKLNNSIISSITCYPFIVDALCVANI